MEHKQYIETATCLGGDIPGITGYGDQVEVVYNQDGSILIGGYRLLACQLEDIVRTHKVFIESCQVFEKGVED